MNKSTNDFSVNQFLFKFRTLMKRKNPFIPESKRIFIFWRFRRERSNRTMIYQTIIQNKSLNQISLLYSYSKNLEDF